MKKKEDEDGNLNRDKVITFRASVKERDLMDEMKDVVAQNMDNDKDTISRGEFIRTSVMEKCRNIVKELE